MAGTNNYNTCNFLKPVTTIGKFLAILPKNYAENSQSWKNSYAYPTVCVAIYIGIYIFNTYGKIVYISTVLESTVFFTEIVSDFCLASTTIGSIIWINIIKGKDENQFISNLLATDDDLHSMEIKIRSSKVRFYTELIVVHILFLLYYVYYFCTWFNSVGFTVFKFFFLKDVQNYHVLMLALILRNYALSMKYRFEALNKTVIAFNPLKNTNLHVSQCISKEIKDIRSYGAAYVKLRKVKKTYTKLIGMMELYNDIFGWCFVGVYINIVFTLLGPVNIAIVYGNGQRDILGSKFGLSLVILCVVWSLLPLVNSWAIFSACNECANEISRTPHICYVLVQDLSTEGIEGRFKTELQELAHEFGNSLPEFTAAGFFTINYSVLFSLVGSISSYLIVLIQFSR